MNTQTKKLNTHIDCVRYSPVSHKLAVATSNLTGQYWNGQLQVLDGNTLKYNKSLPTATGVSEIAWVGDNLLSANDSGCVYLWSFDNAEPLNTFQEHDDLVTSISLNPLNKDQFLSASADSKIKLWDFNKLSPLNTFEGHNSEVTRVRYGSIPEIFASASRDKSAKIWDSRIGKNAPTGTFIHSSAILSFAWNLSTNNFASIGGEDGSLIIYDLRSPATPIFIEKHETKITDLSYSDNNKYLACTSDTGVEVYGETDTKPTKVYRDHSSPFLRSVTWNFASPVSFVTGGWNKELKIHAINAE